MNPAFAERRCGMNENINENAVETKAQLLKKYGMITISILIMAVGVHFFKFPNNFTFGGVTGFAVVFAKLLPVTASGFTFVVNVLLLIVGRIFLGRRFAVMTTYASLLLSVLLLAFDWLWPMKAPLTDQPMLELLFAITLPAVGSALLFNMSASSGGSDVLAMLLKKYTKMQDIGWALFYTDMVMVLAACFVFDVRTALFSFVGLTVKSFLIDGIIENLNLCKSITIVCDDAAPICAFINTGLHRGATFCAAEGAYTHQKKYIIFTTLNRAQAMALRSFLHENQLRAFLLVSSTSEVFGKGFASI